MKDDYKTQNNGKGLYIALAICILTIICVGVYSAVMNLFSTPEYNSPVPQSSQKPQNAPANTRPPQATAAKPQSSLPTPASTAAVQPTRDKEDISVSVVDPAKRVYTRPVVGEVTKDYSDEVLVYSVTMNDYRVHLGVDFASSVGNPVSAFCDGVIQSIEEDPLMGYSVSIDHGDGLVSVYRNLAEILPQGIEVGKSVVAGEVIAGVGESALIECAESPHLHFEVMLNGEAVNPAQYLELE